LQTTAKCSNDNLVFEERESKTATNGTSNIETKRGKSGTVLLSERRVFVGSFPAESQMHPKTSHYLFWPRVFASGENVCNNDIREHMWRNGKL
jgi:hypothetical protein